jgi:Ni,Fe-hydrogenase I large subunit
MPKITEEATANETPPEVKQPLRYEDKYLDKFNKQPSSSLTEDELSRLKNNILMETTPLGNVIFFYDSSKEAFIFYSDATMPYRYLESIGRKYVTIYKCKQIFVDMNEELKQAEEKKNKKLESLSIENNKVKSTTNTEVTKKDVFAKFKTYNNNITKEVVAAPSKNTGSKNISKNDNDNVLLKENANRYTYEGKLANFNILKKIDKKQIDKRLAMSWADYKKQIAK